MKNSGWTGRNGWAINARKQPDNPFIPLRLRWLSQANLTVANDPELLDLAVKSGCFALFIGLESLSEANLKQAGKTFNRPAEYPAAIRRIQRAGIHVWASFIFGLDEFALLVVGLSQTQVGA